MLSELRGLLPENRVLRGLVIGGSTAVTLIAITFVVLAVVAGPLNAVFYTSFMGDTTHRMVEGDPVEVTVTLGHIFASQSIDDGYSKHMADSKDISQTEAENKYWTQYNERFIKLSKAHSVHMAAMGKVTHKSPTGKTFEERMNERGVECTASTSTGDDSVKVVDTGEPFEFVGSFDLKDDYYRVTPDETELTVIKDSEMKNEHGWWPASLKISEGFLEDLKKEGFYEKLEQLEGDKYSIGYDYYVTDDLEVYYTVIGCPV